jgi:hypothetical protein
VLELEHAVLLGVCSFTKNNDEPERPSVPTHKGDQVAYCHVHFFRERFNSRVIEVHFELPPLTAEGLSDLVQTLARAV